MVAYTACSSTHAGTPAPCHAQQAEGPQGPRLMPRGSGLPGGGQGVSQGCGRPQCKARPTGDCWGESPQQGEGVRPQREAMKPPADRVPRSVPEGFWVRGGGRAGSRVERDKMAAGGGAPSQTGRSVCGVGRVVREREAGPGPQRQKGCGRYRRGADESSAFLAAPVACASQWEGHDAPPPSSRWSSLQQGWLGEPTPQNPFRPSRLG